MLNFNEEWGIRVYNDGTSIGHDNITDTYTAWPHTGRIAVGFHGFSWAFASVEVDELRFFNKSLTKTEITALSQIIV